MRLVDGSQAETVGAAAGRVARGWPPVLRAFRARNYRLFFMGQGISLIGTWMQSVAAGWLLYRLTNSPFLLGALGFAAQAPILVLAPLTGVLADRWPLRRVLVITQLLALVQAAALAVLTLTGHVAAWHLLVLSIVLGVINAFDMPARQAFVPQTVEHLDDLGNAIALNSFLMNGARLVGPTLAGVLIAAIGEGPCFGVNAVSYVAVVAALLAMRVKPHTAAPRGRSLGSDFRAGVAYAFSFPPIRDVLGLLALCSFMGMSYGTLMPVFARDVFGGGARTLGFLLGASGLGALAGAAYLASRPTAAGLERRLVWGAGLFGASLVAFSLTRVFAAALPFMLLGGLGMMLQIASSNTLLQTVVDDDKRGRVMALYTIAFLGMMPFGSLLAGGLAHWIGAGHTLTIGGAACLIGAAVFAGRLRTLAGRLRPIYARKGLLSSSA